MNKHRKYYDLQGASELLGVEKKLLEDASDAGYLQTKEMEGRPFVSIQDLESWLAREHISLPHRTQEDEGFIIEVTNYSGALESYSFFYVSSEDEDHGFFFEMEIAGDLLEKREGVGLLDRVDLVKRVLDEGARIPKRVTVGLTGMIYEDFIPDFEGV